MVVIVKPTLKCNIKCKHCYIEGKLLQKQMTEDELQYVLKVIPQGSEVIIHGGEPTLLGVKYYRKTLTNTSHRYSIQTNLTLIDESWVPLIHKTFQGRVSSSFDVYGSLRPVNFKMWVDKVNLLKTNGINPYVVCVLNQGNQFYIKKIYDFFSSLNLSFRLNYIMNIGGGRHHYSDLRHSDGQYARSLIYIFDRWFLSDTNIVVDPVAEIMESFFLGNSLHKCPFTSKCAMHFISINPDGTVIPCGGFETIDISYGNIFLNSLDEILNSPERKKAVKRIHCLPSKCNSCKWSHICNGGCRLEAITTHGDMYSTFSVCEEMKLVFQHIESKIEKHGGYEWYQQLMQQI